MKPIVALMVDLMDRSRLGNAPVHFTKDASQFTEALAGTQPASAQPASAQPPVLAIADLTLPGAAEACATATAATRVVAFAPHERVNELAAPVANTHVEAIARSKFFRQLGDLVEWADSQAR